MPLLVMDVTLVFSLICVCVAAGSDALRSSRPLVLSDGLCQDGWTQDCCSGWTRNSQGQCRPVCESGCKHGECVGPDQCRCHPGFTGKTCSQDVNECAFRPCKYRCMNTLGSFKCYCLNGFMMTADGSCRNARTCALANCQYGCAVMKGEVKCQCPSPGLRLAPDGRTCVDVDECVTGQAKCARFRKCVNTFGSFVCRCHEGFELKHIDGKYHCTDKKFPSICFDKPGHKKCKCTPSVNGKGYDCKSILTVTIEPARPGKVTASPTAIYTPITPIISTEEKTTTTATPNSTVAIATPVPTTSTVTNVTPTTVAMTTTDSTTTTVATPTTNAVTNVTPTTVAMTTIESTTTTITTATTTTSPIITTTATLPTTTTLATTNAVTNVTPTAVAMTTTDRTTTTALTTTTATLTTTSPIVTTTATPVASMTLKTSSTTTLDNRVHRESTAKPRGDVHIPRYENNLFDWDFDVELGNTAEYVRDDPAGVVSCSFDEGLCFWMTNSEGDLKWEIKDDPAGGRYLSVPEATNRRSVKGARLTVTLATPTEAWQGGDLCLTFRHRLHGLHIGSLQVFVRKGQSHSPSIWTRTGGDGWRHSHITLGGRGLVDIVLKAERRRGKHGEIAVDDFTLRRGACGDRDNRTE